MKTRKLKLFNGRDWNCNGDCLYVAAYSVHDAVDLCNQAYRKMNGLEDREDVKVTSSNEINKYWNKHSWGNSMKDITPERGLWLERNPFGGNSKPVRII